MKKKVGPCPRCEGRGEMVKTVTYEGEWMMQCPECLGVGVFHPDAECAFENADGTCERETLRVGRCVCRAYSLHANSAGDPPTKTSTEANQ